MRLNAGLNGNITYQTKEVPEPQRTKYRCDLGWLKTVGLAHDETDLLSKMKIKMWQGEEFYEVGMINNL